MGSIDKQRIIQEMVPGKQVTLAHIIPSPDQEIYQSLGLNGSGALGILTITPSEAAIIAADIARKSSNVHIGFLDRFTGARILCGDVSSVEAAVQSVKNYLIDVLQFDTVTITRG